MSQILSLDGEWDFLFDTEEVGLENRWYANYPTEGLRKVTLPHLWEKESAKLPGTVGFYFRHFHVDAGENPKRIHLRLGGVATLATVWLNGKLLGEHFGAYTPFQFETAKAIKVGEENVLCIRVLTADTGGRFSLMGNYLDPLSAKTHYAAELPVGLPWSQYPFSGITAPVQLVLGNRAFISGLNVVPDPDQERITVELQFNSPRNFAARLRILIANPQGQVAEMQKEIRLERENGSSRLQLGFKDIEWWTPETPRLYTIEIALEKSFSVSQQFGFRKFDCVKGDFYLNDKVTKVMALRYPLHNVAGGLYSDNPEVLRADLTAIRNKGFRFIRTAGAPLPAAGLDICDEIGIMVFQDLPIHMQRSSADGLERVRLLISELVDSTRSHPCIAVWVLGGENGTLMLENGTKLLKQVDNHDLSRPVFSNLNSVYIDNEQNFKKDTGKVLGVTQDRVATFPSFRLHLRSNISRDFGEFLTHFCDKDADPVEVPDLTFGDSSFQENYSSFVTEFPGKSLVTIRNHTLLPEQSMLLKSPAASRNQKLGKALQTLGKGLTAFLGADGPGHKLWSSVEEFAAEANAVMLKSKVGHANAIQSNPSVGAMIIETWSDCGLDLSGFCDENRKFKPGADVVLDELGRSTRLIISVLERTAFPKAKVSFQLALLNEARLESCDVVLKLLDEKGKTVSSTKRKVEGQTSLTLLGEFSVQAPAQEGAYSLEIDLAQGTKVLHTVHEALLVMKAADIESAEKQVCWLDEAESTQDALRAIAGKERTIFTTSASSWTEQIIAKLAEAAKGGKTIILSDMNAEDVDALNSCKQLGLKVSGHWTTGASDASYHFITDNKLRDVFCGRRMLDNVCSSVMPSYSLAEFEDAKVLGRSLTIRGHELIHGVDLQILPYGKGRIIFSQYPLLDNLESVALADNLFGFIVNY